MGILGYDQRKTLESDIRKRTSIVFKKQPMDDQVNQLTINLLNIFENFLETCFGKGA